MTAARTGRLDDLLDQGIAIVEPGALGPGGLAHHRIHANSLGGPFLECLDELPGAPFVALRDLPETRALRAQSDVHPPLALVAPFLTRLGAVVAEIVSAHPRCAVIADRVTGLRLGADAVHVAVAEGDDLTAPRVVVATGGRPLGGFHDAEIVPGLSLAAHRDRVWHSESFVDGRRDAPRQVRRVAVVGGSHSAWSVVDLLLAADPRTEITVIHRSGLRLYYADAAAAHRDGYPFDAVLDVCPASGRVNRYGGLRGRAHELAAAALALRGSATTTVELVQVDSPSGVAAAARALDDAEVIVAATGFEADLPPIRYADGTELVPAVGVTGTVVTPTGHLVDARGAAHPALLAYGLGAGLAPSAEVGGEPSYTRRADGVWLYQHDIGQIVLDDLLSTPAHHPGPAVRTPGEIHA